MPSDGVHVNMLHPSYRVVTNKHTFDSKVLSLGSYLQDYTFFPQNQLLLYTIPFSATFVCLNSVFCGYNYKMFKEILSQCRSLAYFTLPNSTFSGFTLPNSTFSGVLLVSYSKCLPELICCCVTRFYHNVES